MSSQAPSMQIYPIHSPARVLGCLPEEPVDNLGTNGSRSPLEMGECGGEVHCLWSQIAAPVPTLRLPRCMTLSELFYFLMPQFLNA